MSKVVKSEDQNQVETWLANNLEAFEQQKVRITELLAELEQCPRLTPRYRGIKKQIATHQKLAITYKQNALNLQAVLEFPLSGD